MPYGCGAEATVHKEPSATWPTGRPAEQFGGAGIEELAARYGPALLAFARKRLGGDVRTAEDVVQETLIRAWQHPEAFLPNHGSARSWLFTVAQNLVMDVHRRRARLVEVTDDGEVPPRRGPVVDWIDTVLDQHEIHQALGQLSHEHRQVVVEVYLRGRTVAETAARMEIPFGTAKSRLFYALRRMAVILGRRGWGEGAARTAGERPTGVPVGPPARRSA